MNTVILNRACPAGCKGDPDERKKLEQRCRELEAEVKKLKNAFELRGEAYRKVKQDLKSRDERIEMYDKLWDFVRRLALNPGMGCNLMTAEIQKEAKQILEGMGAK